MAQRQPSYYISVVGKCFYYDTPPKGQHLFVVLAPSDQEEGYFICANITEKRELSDTACELVFGCHPALTKPVSIVNYGMARSLPLCLIERLTKRRAIADFTGALLYRIQTIGIAEDSQLPNKFKIAVKAYLRRSPSSPES